MSEDFKRGMHDCEVGLPWKSGQSSEYDNGYAHQYEIEQINSQGNN